MEPRILNAAEIEAGIDRLADLITSRNEGKDFAIVGIRSRGDEVAMRVIEKLKARGSHPILGVLDISLYRDDFEHLHENPTLQETSINFTVEGAHIILVDDVLFTGRTIRAALDALSDYGRPERIELATLVDRGHREMPIQPEYVGIALDTQRLDHVWVSLQKTDGMDEIRISRKPSE
jgi:pyrimidine operon attenuation protein/uracil phosphoribosyltransferase